MYLQEYKNGKHVNIQARFHMCKSRILQPCIVKFWIQPSNSSVQAGFPKKKGQKVRGVPETHGYRNVACKLYGISALPQIVSQSGSVVT